eukprot:GHVO01045845.1.p1 GENE.GHVO01045845.1~~GHVO01045845.1.p1  ORF type:complete len:115 (+),score=4.23 GHVO01045845.1:272-616(+)
MLATDGMRYSVRGHTLYVPPALRQAILYWFHLGQFGGHLGSRRTIRRMKKKVLRGILEKPRPFELVSLDHVGPREWFGKEVTYLVMIDHASRFAMAVQTTTLSAKEPLVTLLES